MTRKICIVIASRANYSRVKYLMKAISEKTTLELQIVVGASALLYKYGNVSKVMREDGFIPNCKIHYLVEGENLSTQAKSTGLGIIELATAFQSLEPDVVISVADRYETIATAISSSLLNIPLAHIQGGEVSGNIDDSVRNAVTKLAHLHYPSTTKSAERIKRMGEEPWRVFCSGCPSIDILTNTNLALPNADFFADKGTGVPFNPMLPYILILQHPVTSSVGSGADQIRQTLLACKKIKMNKLMLWPNPDAGSDDVSKTMREFHNENPNLPFSYHINFTPEIFASLLANAHCLVGNSSSFIREGSFLGTPAVIVGDRQKDRERGKNVIFSDYNKSEIYQKVLLQLKHGKYKSESIFGHGNAGRLIASHLEKADLKIIKEATY